MRRPASILEARIFDRISHCGRKHSFSRIAGRTINIWIMTSTICDDGVTSVSGRIHFRPAAERTRRQLARRRLHRPIRKLKSTRCRLNDAVDDEPIRHSDEAGGDIYVERSQPIPDAILVARGGEQEVQISALDDARPQISLSQAPETARCAPCLWEGSLWPLGPVRSTTTPGAGEPSRYRWGLSCGSTPKTQPKRPATLRPRIVGDCDVGKVGLCQVTISAS